MEAFSQQTPVIASNIGRIPALIEQTGGGLVYSNEQELVTSMDRLLTDPLFRSQLGVRAHLAYRQEWTADAHLERYLALIDGIAARVDAGETGMPTAARL